MFDYKRLYNVLFVEEYIYKRKHRLGGGWYKCPSKFTCNKFTYDGFCQMPSTPLPISSVKFIINNEMPNYNVDVVL